MTNYSPAQREIHNELLREGRYIAGGVAGILVTFSSVSIITEYTPMGDRFMRRQELGFQIDDVHEQQTSLEVTAKLLQENGYGDAYDDTNALIDAKTKQIAEVRSEKDTLGNVYIDNSAIFGPSLMLGALVGTLVFKKLTSKMYQEPPRRSRY